MKANKTASFLGHEYSWSKAGIELQDAQPLLGGVTVRLPGYTMSQVFVTHVAPGGEETKYRLPLGWDEKEKLCQLCVDQDFLTIRPQERAGLPDEARPTITLTNAHTESHTVSKWAGIADARFDAVYHALLALAERTTGQRPIPARFNRWQKGLAVAGVAGGLLLLLLLAYALARPLVASRWPARFSLLFALLLLLLGLFLAGTRGLAWVERHKSQWDRSFTHPWVVMAVNVLFFLALIGVAGLGETAVGAWRTASPVSAGDERAVYAIVAYTALFAAGLIVAAAGVAMDPLMHLIDERF